MNTVRFRLGLAALLLCSSVWGGESPAIDSHYFAVLRGGEVRALRDALDKGAPVDARDASGNTPLMHAAVYGNATCVRLLVDRGADVNATNAAGATALLRAASDYEKVRLLLDHGASVNARSGLGNTALLLAARPANSHRTVELLLQHGADPKVKSNAGATPLMAAAAGGDMKTVQRLLKAGADVNAQPNPDQMGFVFGGGRTALMWAAFRGDLATLKLLLGAGANVNAMGGQGTALAQAAWANETDAARLLIEHGARVDQAGPKDGYTPLHWAVSTEEGNAGLTALLLKHGADANLGGGEPVDAFATTPQTPLMLARRRGESPVLTALIAAGATNATADKLILVPPAPQRHLPAQLDRLILREAVARAVPLLQETSIRSKRSFENNGQNCTSCHQQYLPMAALGLARNYKAAIDQKAEQELIAMVRAGNPVFTSADWEVVFHPEPVHSKGYELLAFAGERLPADESTDAAVHHLLVVQGAAGEWHNNLPRPPMQTGDIGATALAIHGLQRYAFPGQHEEFARRVNRARQWLWRAAPKNTESRVYQLLGLSWAGESARKLQPLAKALAAEQRADGGWAQLPGLQTDAYATAQAVYALRVAAEGAGRAAADRGTRWLVENQLEDGSWHVRRRAFPFQPTLTSGFPHGRDSWISAAATSWAVMALSLPAAASTEMAAETPR